VVGDAVVGEADVVVEDIDDERDRDGEQDRSDAEIVDVGSDDRSSTGVEVDEYEPLSQELLAMRADELFAQRVEQEIGAAPAHVEATEVRPSERIFLLQYDSHPLEFWDALVGGTPLRACRHALEAAGHSCVLPVSNAKIFVDPSQWHAVMSVLLGRDDLRPYHVVVAEQFEHLVEESVLSIRCKKRPKMKGHGRTQLWPVAWSPPGDKDEDKDEPDADVFADLSRDATWEPRLHIASSVTQSATTTTWSSERRNPRRRDPMARQRYFDV